METVKYPPKKSTGLITKCYVYAAKSLQSCPTLCDPKDSSPPSSPVPGILQARTLEWVAISFFNDESEKWKWSRSVMSDSSRPHGLQPTRLLRSWDFPGKSTGVGCHCLLLYLYTIMSTPRVYNNMKRITHKFKFWSNTQKPKWWMIQPHKKIYKKDMKLRQNYRYSFLILFHFHIFV